MAAQRCVTDTVTSLSESGVDNIRQIERKENDIPGNSFTTLTPRTVDTSSAHCVGGFMYIQKHFFFSSGLKKQIIVSHL